MKRRALQEKNFELVQKLNSKDHKIMLLDQSLQKHKRTDLNITGKVALN